MQHVRRFAAALALSLAAATAGAGAQTAAPAPPALRGTILSVDYSDATMVVQTPKGRVTVDVTPSTSVMRGAADENFTDLKSGMRVTIDVSRADGRIVAQIVRIR